MTKDEIIEMAREVGIEQDGDMWFSNLYKTDMDVHISHLETFAKLVAAKVIAQRTWIGLTDNEFNELYDRYVPLTCYALLIEKVEAKLKQKNGYFEEKNT